MCILVVLIKYGDILIIHFQQLLDTIIYKYNLTSLNIMIESTIRRITIYVSYNVFLP